MKEALINRLTREKKQDMVHSSAYAKVQSGDSMGAASYQGFRARMAMEQNRQVIGGYKDSGIMNRDKKAIARARAYGMDAARNKTENGDGGKTGVSDRVERFSGRGFGAGDVGARGEMRGGGALPPRKNPGISR